MHEHPIQEIQWKSDSNEMTDDDAFVTAAKNIRSSKIDLLPFKRKKKKTLLFS